jgi:hypothetical protein
MRQFPENGGYIKSVRSASDAFKLHFGNSVMEAIVLLKQTAVLKN